MGHGSVCVMGVSWRNTGYPPEWRPGQRALLQNRKPGVLAYGQTDGPRKLSTVVSTSTVVPSHGAVSAARPVSCPALLLKSTITVIISS